MVLLVLIERAVLAKHTLPYHGGSGSEHTGSEHLTARIACLHGLPREIRRLVPEWRTLFDVRYMNICATVEHSAFFGEVSTILIYRMCSEESDHRQVPRYFHR